MFSGGLHYNNINSFTCTDVRELVFSQFQNKFLRSITENHDEIIIPEVSGNLIKTRFDDWTLENYIGKNWHTTTISKWFKKDGKGYTIQARSKHIPGTIDPSDNIVVYAVVLYDEVGKATVTIEPDACECFLQVGHYYNKQDVKIMESALKMITGRDWDVFTK